MGRKVSSADANKLSKNIGIIRKGVSALVKAQITSVKGVDASIVFEKNENLVTNKRNEKRNNVNLTVKITDLDGVSEIYGMIVDAGNNGCRIHAEGLTSMPEEVVLTVKIFQKPVVAEFAWRNETSAGLRLLWDRTLEESAKIQE